MYALVNTMSKSDRSYGRIISRNRSIEGAVKAGRKLNRLIKSQPGQQTSYIPTTVVYLHTHAGKGSSEALRIQCTEVDTNYM
jgi:hypothetical protein